MTKLSGSNRRQNSKLIIELLSQTWAPAESTVLNPDDGGGKLVTLSKRDSGYGGGHHDGYCESTGLEIFVFLLFLVYLLDLIQTILMNAMINIMINDT